MDLKMIQSNAIANRNLFKHPVKVNYTLKGAEGE
jgi:hypothetical protein